MGIELRIFLIVAIIVYLLIIFNLLRKKSLNLKYTLIWLVSAVVMLIVAIFPDLFLNLSSIVGIVDGTNFVFVVEAMFVLIILLSLTSIVSHLNDKNRKLIQSVALLEKRMRQLEKAIKDPQTLDMEDK